MKHCTLRNALLVTSFIVVTGFTLDAAAKTAPPTTCVSPIAKCGCTITKGGSYTLGPGPFNMTGVTTTDCIDISAAKVNLRTNGVAITGGGSGVGINILKSATSANVQLADPSKPTVPSAISNFTNGIEVQGSGVILNNFDVSNNTGDGLVIKGASNCSVINFMSNNSATGNGVTISGGSGCQIDAFTASGNGGFGLALSSARSETLENFDADDLSGAGNTAGGIELISSSANTLSNFTADHNLATDITLSNSSKNSLFMFSASGSVGSGIVLSASSSNSIFDFEALDNAVYGVWLQDSSSNSVRSALALGNTEAGIYLGCSPTAPGTNDCPGKAKPSSKNTVTAIQAGNDAAASLPQLFGVAVDLGDLQNNLSGITATGDTTDLQDLNVSCGTNVWFANAGASFNPTCTAP